MCLCAVFCRNKKPNVLFIQFCRSYSVKSEPAAIKVIHYYICKSVATAEMCRAISLWSTEKPHWSLGLSSLFWQNMINKTPLRREGVQCSVFLLLLVVEFNQGLQVNHVARVEIYSTSTSQPGICFLNPDDVFLGVVEFVDLRSDKEVDETWDEKKKEQTKSIIYLTFHRVVLSPMFMFLMMMMMMMMMMMSIYLNLNIHFYSQQKWGYITWEPGGGLIIRP